MRRNLPALYIEKQQLTRAHAQTWVARLSDAPKAVVPVDVSDSDFDAPGRQSHIELRKSEAQEESQTTKALGMVKYRSLAPAAYEPGDVYKAVV